MPKPIYMLMLVSTMLALCACGITGNYRKDPGYAVFSSPGFRDTDRQLALSLGRLPIGLASRLAPMFIDDEPEIVELLRSIRGIRVYIYEIGGDAERVSARVDETRSNLLDDGWDSIVAVRDDGGIASAFVKIDEQHTVRGMAVVFQDEDELVLVNLIGEVRPETFNVYMAELGIYAPDIMVASL